MNATENLSSGVSAFEHYMLVDDRPKYPMVVWFVMTFQGQAEEARLSAALNQALTHHPMLSSHLIGDRRGLRAKLLWRHVKNATVYLDVGPEGSPLRFPTAQTPESENIANEDRKSPIAIDLSREIGVRAFLRQGRENCTVHFQFHHSVTDGLGAMGFLEEVLRYYDGAGAKVAKSVANFTCDTAVFGASVSVLSVKSGAFILGFFGFIERTCGRRCLAMSRAGVWTAFGTGTSAFKIGIAEARSVHQ